MCICILHIIIVAPIIRTLRQYSARSDGYNYWCNIFVQLIIRCKSDRSTLAWGKMSCSEFQGSQYGDLTKHLYICVAFCCENGRIYTFISDVFFLNANLQLKNRKKNYGPRTLFALRIFYGMTPLVFTVEKEKLNFEL